MESESHEGVTPTPWSVSLADLYSAYTSTAEGLGQADIPARLHRYGPNRLKVSTRRGVASILAAQFKSLMVLFLLMAVALSAKIGFARATM